MVKRDQEAIWDLGMLASFKDQQKAAAVAGERERVKSLGKIIRRLKVNLRPTSAEMDFLRALRELLKTKKE
jgi:hypothetical protein